MCEEIRFYVPPRAALACTKGGPMEGSSSSGESLYALDIIVVDGGRARRALHVPIAAGPLDREAPPREDDPNEGNYIQLAMDVDAANGAIVLREKGPRACTEALVRVKAYARTLRVTSAACAARGRYVWRGDRFVR
jgi:hypothetical protein